MRTPSVRPIRLLAAATNPHLIEMGPCVPEKLKMNNPGSIRIGISGWRYKGWRGTFYPAGLAQRKELEFASRQFDTIELNGSFYSLQRPESFAAWYDETPQNFIFAVKGSRFVTHMLKLLRVE